MIELIVAMGLFTLFVSLLVGGIVGFTRATTESRLDAQTSSAVGAALKRLEKSARYADAINYPGVVSGKAYVEWRVDAVSAPTGVTTCYQLRYTASARTLALRSWASGSSPAAATWTVILSGVRGPASTSYPFMTIAAGAASNYQGLTVSVATGLDADTGTTTSSTVYAKNSSSDSTSNATASSGQSLNPICAVSGSLATVRP